jgi:hypothetical protein
VTRPGVGGSSGARGNRGAKGSRRRERGRFGIRDDASRLEGGLPKVRARTTIFPPFGFGHRRAFPLTAQASERGARRGFRAARGPGGCFTLVSTPQTRFAGFPPPATPPMRAFPPSRDARRWRVFYGSSRRFSPERATPRRSRRRARRVRARRRRNARGAASASSRATRFGEKLSLGPSRRSADRRFRRPTARLTDLLSPSSLGFSH